MSSGRIGRTRTILACIRHRHLICVVVVVGGCYFGILGRGSPKRLAPRTISDENARITGQKDKNRRP